MTGHVAALEALSIVRQAALRCPMMRHHVSEVLSDASLAALATKCPVASVSVAVMDANRQLCETCVSKGASCCLELDSSAGHRGDAAEPLTELDKNRDQRTKTVDHHVETDKEKTCERGLGQRREQQVQMGAEEAAVMHQEEKTAMDYESVFAKTIRELKDEKKYRVFTPLSRIQGSFPRAHRVNSDVLERVSSELPHEKQQPVTIMCGNDYLGMGQNAKVLGAMKDAVDMYGAGAGGTRNISGNTHLHIELERELAALHQKEAALLFSSCFVCNDATLSTLPKILGRETVYFSDALNHASMIEGIRHAGVRKHVFKHNSLAHLESLLKMYPHSTPKIVAFESVYSMEGTIAPISDICDLAKQYGALTFLDEVHAVGLYGDHGAGVAERDHVLHKVDMITGTLGKGFGVFGGYLAASANLVDCVRSKAPGFIFTTSLPPVVAAGSIASIRHLRESQVERSTHQFNAAWMKAKLTGLGFPVMDSVSHIVPVVVGDAVLCKRVCDLLMTDHGMYVQPINFPTVPVGTERLRITPSAVHSMFDMERFVQALKTVWTQLGLPLSGPVTHATHPQLAVAA
eukprot:ANDGO_01210.mRNA.1 5-aminolevulinate synthase